MQVQQASRIYNQHTNDNFLYSYNKQSEKEIKKTILFIIALKRIKQLGINFIKEVPNSFERN